jgi:hypothetical protein
MMLILSAPGSSWRAVLVMLAWIATAEIRPSVLDSEQLRIGGIAGLVAGLYRPSSRPARDRPYAGALC